ncbi:hypothetical protein D9M71_782240 [compost metagenome]
MGSAAMVHRAIIPIAKVSANDAIASTNINLKICTPICRNLSGTEANRLDCKTVVSSERTNRPKRTAARTKYLPIGVRLEVEDVGTVI